MIHSCKKGAVMKIRYFAVSIASLLLVFSILLTGCANEQPGESSDAPASESSSTSDSEKSSSSTQEEISDNSNQMFSERDSRTDYDKSSCILINLNGDSISCSSKTVVIDGNTATITDKGTYVVSGSLNDGMIAVRAEKTDKLQIVLNNASITSKTCAPIYVATADKVFLTLADNTENTLSNGGSFTPLDTNNIDAVIYSAEDLTLNGNGRLTIKSPAGHGVVSKDDLVVTGGSYSVTSGMRGFDANDSVRIKDADITLTTGKDAIRAENLTDTTKGFVYMQSGKININSKGDGISSSGYTQITGGELNITTSSTDELASLKGIKTADNLMVNGGKLEFNTGDHALKSDKGVYIKNGELTIKTTTDAMNAGEMLSISGGIIKAPQCRQGFDSPMMEITGGDIDIASENDCISASVKDINAAEQDAELYISGGELKLSTSGGDCIDVKGIFVMQGGEVFAQGAKVAKSHIITSDRTVTITDGTIIGFGWNAPKITFSENSIPVVAQTVTQIAAGDNIELKTPTSSILSLKATAECDNLLIIVPELERNVEYSLTAGNDTYTVQAQ